MVIICPKRQCWASFHRSSCTWQSLILATQGASEETGPCFAKLQNHSQLSLEDQRQCGIGERKIKQGLKSHFSSLLAMWPQAGHFTSA